MYTTLSRHPNSIGGKAMVLAKQQLEQGARPICAIILKGLYLKCSLRDDFEFEEYEVNEAGMLSPRISVKVKSK